jgi:ATP-binding cassette subfamily B (MDR/TAP) protein 1
MLLVVATGLGFSYFALGWISNTISAASTSCRPAIELAADRYKNTVTTYRKEYFRNIIWKRVSFFDDANNSAGLLSARLATDPVQLQQLLGMNMAMLLISIFSLIGCIAVAEAFHWRFATIVIVSSLPIILAGGWYRVRHELKFEARNNAVFADSAQFATEAIGAIRTVVSLTLERAVCEKYNALLKKHIYKSWKEARVSCLAFAGSDSLVLLCMAFALW